MDEKRLFEKLDIITKLLAINTLKDKSLKEQVNMLSDLGLQPTEISSILGKSANLIRVTKAGLKKKKGENENEW